MKRNVLHYGPLLIAAFAILLSGANPLRAADCEADTRMTINGTISKRDPNGSFYQGSNNVALELEKGASPCQVDQIEAPPAILPAECTAGRRVRAAGRVDVPFIVVVLIADSVRCDP